MWQKCEAYFCYFFYCQYNLDLKKSHPSEALLVPQVHAGLPGVLWRLAASRVTLPPNGELGCCTLLLKGALPYSILWTKTRPTDVTWGPWQLVICKPSWIHLAMWGYRKHVKILEHRIHSIYNAFSVCKRYEQGLSHYTEFLLWCIQNYRLGLVI